MTLPRRLRRRAPRRQDRRSSRSPSRRSSARELPELDDEFAADAAGFDTLDELREDIRDEAREAEESAIEAEFREAVLDAAVANATVDVPDALVEARAVELWEQMMHSLAHQGISKEAYLQISGKTEEEILAEAKPDAEQALKREAVLAAVVEAEEIEPSDGELLDALPASAERENTTPEKLLRAAAQQAGRARRRCARDLAPARRRVDLARRARQADRRRSRGRRRARSLDAGQGLDRPGCETVQEPRRQPASSLSLQALLDTDT